MKFRVAILLLMFSMPLMVRGAVDPGGKNKEKEKKKAKTISEKQPIHSIEQLAFMIPEAPANDCAEHKAFKSAVINYYQWYLQNENRITNGLSRETKGKDLMPPFNISWETLHEYFEFIQKKYAGWLPADVPAQNYDSGPDYPNDSYVETPAVDSLTNGTTVNLSNLAK